MSDNLNKIEEILNQIGYRGFVAGQQKDSENADNLMEQSEISIKRATQALTTIINNEKIASYKKGYIDGGIGAINETR